MLPLVSEATFVASKNGLGPQPKDIENVQINSVQNIEGKTKQYVDSEETISTPTEI